MSSARFNNRPGPRRWCWRLSLRCRGFRPEHPDPLIARANTCSTGAHIQPAQCRPSPGAARQRSRFPSNHSCPAQVTGRSSASWGGGRPARRASWPWCSPRHSARSTLPAGTKIREWHQPDRRQAVIPAQPGAPDAVSYFFEGLEDITAGEPGSTDELLRSRTNLALLRDYVRIPDPALQNGIRHLIRPWRATG